MVASCLLDLVDHLLECLLIFDLQKNVSARVMVVVLPRLAIVYCRQVCQLSAKANGQSP